MKREEIILCIMEKYGLTKQELLELLAKKLENSNENQKEDITILKKTKLDDREEK